MDRGLEQQLVASARKGEQDAFFRLFDAHFRPLFRFAFRLTGSEMDAEDIVQECFLALYRSRNCFDPERAALRTYLFGAVRNQALKRMRSRETACEEVPARAIESCPESRLVKLEMQDAVALAVARLPVNQREVLLLAHYEQMALAEIAELLGIELGAAKSRLQRARASLKDALAEYAPSAGRVAK